MRITALALAGLALASAVPTVEAAARATEVLVLDLTNWGEGVYYLKGRILGAETNGVEGFQDAPTLVANAAGDAVILP